MEHFGGAPLSFVHFEAPTIPPNDPPYDPTYVNRVDRLQVDATRALDLGVCVWLGGGEEVWVRQLYVIRHFEADKLLKSCCT